MITGELKNKIDSLWNTFWTGGLTNPLEVIEQMTYLMFIRDLDDMDNLRAREAAMLDLPYKSIFAGEVTIGDRTIDGSQLKWSVFRDFPAGKMYTVMQEWVFPFIKNLHGSKDSAYTKYMDDAIFKLPTPLLLDKVVTAMDEIYRLMNDMQASDVRGDVYEYLLATPLGRHLYCTAILSDVVAMGWHVWRIVDIGVIPRIALIVIERVAIAVELPQTRNNHSPPRRVVERRRIEIRRTRVGCVAIPHKTPLALDCTVEGRGAIVAARLGIAHRRIDDETRTHRSAILLIHARVLVRSKHLFGCGIRHRHNRCDQKQEYSLHNFTHLSIADSQCDDCGL